MMKLIYPASLMIIAFIEILLIFFIYKDVANYFPIPQLNMAQFFGVVILLECIFYYFKGVIFIKKLSEIDDREQIGMSIVKFIAIVILFLLYQVVKLFL